MHSQSQVKHLSKFLYIYGLLAWLMLLSFDEVVSPIDFCFRYSLQTSGVITNSGV